MTRANIIVKKGNRRLFFYRHNDGYPDGLGKDLKSCIVEDPIYTLFNIIENCDLEPTDSIHGDIDYLYTITFCSDCTIFECESVYMREMVEIKTYKYGQNSN